MQSATRAQSPNSQVETWLEHLPLEILATIVSLLPSFRRLKNDKQNYQKVESLPDALSLSLVSATQRRAVAVAHEHLFRIYRVNDALHARQLVRHWRTVLGSNIREVFLPNNIGVNCDICDILALPSLRKATIPAFPSLIRALAHGRSVHSLDIRITNTSMVARESGLDHLAFLLRVCPIISLTLNCLSCGGFAIWSHGSCISLQVLANCRTGDIRNVNTVSTTLRSLRLVCESHRLHGLTFLPRLFPNLDTFCLKISIHEVHMSNGPLFSQPVINTLKSIPNLGFVDCGLADLFAQHFGARVTEFTSWMLHSTTSLASLNACPNLKSLHLLLSENVIHHFPSNISSLRSLILEWDGDYYNAQEGYFTPRTTHLIDVIQRNTQLCELRLKKVRVPYPDVETIITTAGSGMQVLEIPIYKQRESVMHRFDKIVKLVMKHSPLLRILEFDVDSTFCRGSENHAVSRDHDPTINDHHPEDDPGDVVNCQRCKFWNMVDAAFSLLRPRLQALSEEGFIQLKQTLRYRWESS